MNIMERIINKISRLTKHNYIKLTSRGNTAIRAAVSIIEGTVLIPEEGGWLSYKRIKDHQEVKCDDVRINLHSLKQKLSSISFAQEKERHSVQKASAFLYQNPGGYFADQPMKEIYQLCQEYGCLVIVDVSGSIGTELCDGRYADVLVGSFGKWKLVEAGGGGFISCKNKELFDKLSVEELADKKQLNIILEKLSQLPQRIRFLQQKRRNIIEDMSDMDIVHKEDTGFVVVIRYNSNSEKEKVIYYCDKHLLEWTECPRYIRLNRPALSIEVKRIVNPK